METSKKLAAWKQVKEIDLQEKSAEELIEFCNKILAEFPTLEIKEFLAAQDSLEDCLIAMRIEEENADLEPLKDDIRYRRYRTGPAESSRLATLSTEELLEKVMDYIEEFFPSSNVAEEFSACLVRFCISMKELSSRELTVFQSKVLDLISKVANETLEHLEKHLNETMDENSKKRRGMIWTPDQTDEEKEAKKELKRQWEELNRSLLVLRLYRCVKISKWLHQQFEENVVKRIEEREDDTDSCK